MEKSTKIRGATVRWEERGDEAGLPVVFLHGIPTSPALWRHVLPLMGNTRCLAFELVGFGHSIPEGWGRDISVANQANYVADWLKSLGIEKAVFAGHDLGGGVAQILAVRHPELCAGLFLTNCIAYDNWPILEVKLLQTARPLVGRLPDLVGKQILRALMHRGHDTPARTREGLDVHWQAYEKHDGPQALARQVKQLDVRDTLSIVDQLGEIKVPARVAWGAADQLLELRYGERLAKDLGAPLRLIDNGKHFTPEDHPDIVAEEIQSLLADATAAHPTAPSES